MRDLVIVGAGGFGREVCWLIEENNKRKPQWQILGFVDDPHKPHERLRYPIVGDDEWLLNYAKPICAVICIANTTIRGRIAQRLKQNPHLSFPVIQAHDALIGSGSTAGEGSIICSGVKITVDATIGDFCIVNLNCTVGHDACLDNLVTLYPDVKISGHVKIGQGSEIGTGTAVIQGLSLGERCVVGAGAAVISDLPADCTAVGVPARVIKVRGGETI
ncbi:MAG: acetyltransferase [Succinivibrio sp.]|nr:acetyltransferase [Succinivibrio sp.]